MPATNKAAAPVVAKKSAAAKQSAAKKAAVNSIMPRGNGPANNAKGNGNNLPAPEPIQRARYDREAVSDDVLLGVMRGMPDTCKERRVQAVVNAIRAAGYSCSMARAKRLIPEALKPANHKRGRK
jgi:hypothetical protein